MADDSDMIIRQVGLTFALLNSPEKRDVAWVQRHVDGYGGRSRDAAGHLIRRDVAELRRLWVPAHFVDGEVWVDKDLYELPPVDLTAEEASVVGLAVDLSQPGSLGSFARSGWTKLAASGATRNLDAPTLVSVSNDIFQLRPETLRAIVACVRNKQRMSFDFVRAPGKDPERRVVDPWGVVSLNNRAYFVGYDIDRGAERVFRVKKISQVKRVNTSEQFHEQERELQSIVEASLRGDLVDATVTVANGAGEELAMRGKRIDDTITLTSVDRDWVVRAIASIAGSVIAVEPAGVREDVVKLLRSAKGKEPHEH
ncbi:MULTISPECIES: helix-turn-helix transcriptional regulator [Corynebacterium]|uniref:helix-turn-helix transcriptional regulator n=1 Tax=Corynebacterium TaxID=1716 RepID=UPI0008A99BC9|nr:MULTISPECIES: WYL domain-containing protein [Corynebacterium]MDK6492471.1 WYL domain-containing protein [Corynebacterium coyleae]MDK8663103.1 WYL domain-containing protein [Corynebacterium coyleae]MDK8705851.1 WYL domain-containing protein [Corynebacterium coyleae]MDK8733062.1 WYL domain-containing protein [Corynebacterium coyleae]MDK8891892.1 WYL domain-containing protein [Corynebacterium coyleae]